MKKLILGLLMAVSFYSNAQEYKIEEKAVTGIFEVPNKSKAEIFSAISKWISINYNSGKSVTQLSDAEGGNIVVKGINEITYSNTKFKDRDGIEHQIFKQCKISEIKMLLFNNQDKITNDISLLLTTNDIEI